MERTCVGLDIGATLVHEQTVRFRVWAPHAKAVAVTITAPEEKTAPLQSDGAGYFEGCLDGVAEHARYVYVLDGIKTRPDPASRFQPDGVHGPSAVVDPGAFSWTDQAWKGLALRDYILYELHVGTFTEDGTFDAIIPRLPYLKHELGVTAIELMPVAQFPGTRNWGYDGAHPFAPHNGYGGPTGLKRLIDACHGLGLAVVLDVVYNHLGPEGNYLQDYGPYFTDRYRTPWGQAINYDGPDSDPVRRYFIGNALYWIGEYHIDALRLDAIHGIFDFSARHILQELAEAVQREAERLHRLVQVIAESDLNDTRVIRPQACGGHGCDAQWNDDFHHALRVLLTKETSGYYQDFTGMADLVLAVREGFVYADRYSTFRRRRHGNSSKEIPPSQFVVFSQNHDQVGNRADGARLSTQLSLSALKAAAALVLLSPNIPLLFMGEEYGERAPFQYFIDHGDPALVEAVRRGRREEFAPFGWREDDIPDPQSPSTFERSRVRSAVPTDSRSQGLLRWYHDLIDTRKRFPVLGAGIPGHHHTVWSDEGRSVLLLHRWLEEGPSALLVLTFDPAPQSIRLHRPGGVWRSVLNAASTEYGEAGDGQTHLPAILDLSGSGTAIVLPPYAGVLYLSPDHGPFPA
jgi:maltooligosyltrehalose trehalohydrolase